MFLPLLDYFQPPDRLSQCFDGLGLQYAAGMPPVRGRKPRLKIDLPVTQCQMVARRCFRPVMDVEMDQPVLMFLQETGKL